MSAAVTPRRPDLLRRWLVAAALLLATAGGVSAQPTGGPPLEIRLFLEDPPAGAIYEPAAQINAVLQVKAASQFVTPEGFSADDWRRYLVLSRQGSSAVVSAGASFHRHADARAFSCLRRSGVRQSLAQFPPTAVTPAETVAGPPEPFFLEFDVDVRALFGGLGPGEHVLEVRYPLIVAEPGAVLDDCDGFSVPVVELNATRSYQVVSNAIEFVAALGTFEGFFFGFDFDATPVTDDNCGAPCRTFNFGNRVPVSLVLLDASGSVVSTASVQAIVSDAAGMTVLSRTFRFDAANQGYLFDLDTAQLAPGSWRITARLPEGHTRSVAVDLAASFDFVGFKPPLSNDQDCPALPCNVANVGSTVPLKFQLFVPGTSVPIEDANVRALLTGVSPAVATRDVGRFRFQNSQDAYTHSLRTNQLAPGVWRIDARFSDDSVRTVHIRLK